MEQRFDEMRREILGQPAAVEERFRMPACDVVDEEGQFVVTAELPGFEKRDVRLEVEEGGLHIRATKERREERGKGTRYLRRERYSQMLERFVPLPEEISPDGVRATFRNGILEAIVPKTAPEKRRRRAIEID